MALNYLSVTANTLRAVDCVFMLVVVYASFRSCELSNVYLPLTGLFFILHCYTIVPGYERVEHSEACLTMQHSLCACPKLGSCNSGKPFIADDTVVGLKAIKPHPLFYIVLHSDNSHLFLFFRLML